MDYEYAIKIVLSVRLRLSEAWSCAWTDEMELAAVAGAIAGAVVALALFFLLCYTVYVFIQHRRYSHIPSPKGAWQAIDRFMHALLLFAKATTHQDARFFLCRFFFGHAFALSSKMKQPNQYFSRILFDWYVHKCGTVVTRRRVELYIGRGL